jgi:hypothetical protein
VATERRRVFIIVFQREGGYFGDDARAVAATWRGDAWRPACSLWPGKW